MIEYPKVVFPEGTEGKGVTVTSAEEEAEVMGKKAKPEKKAKEKDEDK